MSFHAHIRESWRRSNSSLCVGLDPDAARMPAPLQGEADAVYRFCVEIVDATADLVCAFKPQFAYFAAQRAEPALERVCTYIRENYPHVTLVLDAKRGDIGSTAEQYALEAFSRYGAHVVTVNPYLGLDSVQPYFEHGAILALCRTSNPGGADLQNLAVPHGDGTRPLYMHVADLVANDWSRFGECGLVVGATYPDELAAVRAVAPSLPILVPGFGQQGGDAAAAMRAGGTPDGFGLMISSSRAVLYASSGDDFAEAARSVAIESRLAALPTGW
ncbi:MAG TPA: orotidine-5'-phosphate decarboxylase [Ilumatobacter sp.]|nr:orotidine-5'-phosphate decarboxylase [Ilumatobacter sp.]